MRGGDSEAEVVWGQAFTGVFGTETREQKVKKREWDAKSGWFFAEFRGFV
jgi:hypothetical protein